VKPAEDPYRAIEFGLPLPPARPIELERSEIERAPTIAIGTPMEIDTPHELLYHRTR